MINTIIVIGVIFVCLSIGYVLFDGLKFAAIGEEEIVDDEYKKKEQELNNKL